MTQAGDSVTCPHCGAANAWGSTFCGSCGKALPAANPSGPRILSGDQFASTVAGQSLQGGELQKQMKKASGALLAVAVIQTIFTFIFYGIVSSKAGPGAQLNMLPFVLIGGVAAIFWGLYFWARHSPFPAAVAGLVVYITLWLLDAIAWFSTQSGQNSNPAANGGPFQGIILKIIIIAVLVNAIKAGSKYRELQRQSSSGFPVGPGGM